MVSAGTYVNGSSQNWSNLPNVRAVRWSHPGMAMSAG